MGLIKQIINGQLVLMAMATIFSEEGILLAAYRLIENNFQILRPPLLTASYY